MNEDGSDGRWCGLLLKRKKKNKIKLNENDPNIRFAGAISEFYI